MDGWCAIISLPYKRNHCGDYAVERVQPQLLEVLQDRSACTGVGVRRDVLGFEEFYSLLSGKDVELNGFRGFISDGCCCRFQAKS